MKNSSASRSTLREWGANLLTLAVTLALAWGAAEAYVAYAIDDGMQFDMEMWRYAKHLKRRSANPQIGHEHTPNTQAHLMGVDVEISSQGLRDREFQTTPPQGRTRILMLGDSLTFGWGVPGDRTYSKRLEDMLRQAGHDVEVINTGVGNYNTEMEVAYFLERGAKFQPHYVVLNYFINDAEPTPREHSNFLSRNSPAFVYFASRLDMALRMAGLGDRQDWKSYYAGLYDQEGIARVSAAVKRLADYCRTHGIKLFLVNQPELRNPANYPFPQVEEFVAQLAAQNHLKYLSMLPAVRNLEPETLWVTPPDPHPSIVAHEVFAKALFALFEAELAPAKSPGPAPALDARRL